MWRLCLRVSIFTLAMMVALPTLAAEGRTPVFLDGSILGTDGKYILTRNIVGAGAGPVIVIAAPNVDLDLNGFTILAAAGTPGIEIPIPSPIDVKIHNGSIVGGTTGILRLPGPPGQRVVIEDMKLRDQTGDGIFLDSIETIEIRRASIRSTGGAGIVIFGPVFSNGVIEDCSIKETFFAGILVDTVAALEIKNNRLEVPGTSGLPGTGGIILSAAVGCLLSQNVISDPSIFGIIISDSKGNKINNNVIRHAFSTGIHVGPSSGDNLIIDNVVSDCGFDIPPGHGLWVEGFQNQIHGNTLNSNESCGMLFDGTSFGNTFGRNMARGNGAGGGCGLPCVTLFPPDSCDLSGAGNDTSTENMIPFLF